MTLKKYKLSIVAMAFVGLGTYQAYGSYAFSERSPKSQLLAENIEALSENDDRETSYIRTDAIRLKMNVPNKFSVDTSQP